MSGARLVSVLGLGFGDCGKGLLTDFLVRRHRAHTVVRFNGGAQAGHNVVIPDGRRHTFSQFGAGTFSAGVFTVLARPVVVHPTALLEEARVLAEAGIGDAFERLLIDARCLVTTPFHQAAGRLREWQRGAAAHGTCGAGFGETVRHALNHAEQALHWGDLSRIGSDGAARDVEARVEAIRHTLRNDHLERGEPPALASAEARAEWRCLDDSGLARRWLALARQVARRAAPGGTDAVLGRLARPGTLVFEGAQGVLLDERHGFHPHTTWSTVGTAAVEAVAAEAGHCGEVTHLGILRSHLTRHGAGPLPTEDPALSVTFAEAHNGSAGWQGRFRHGHADAVLLHYALAAVGSLHGLVVSHLDAFDRAFGLGWCTAYRAPQEAGDALLCIRDPAVPDRIVALRKSETGCLDHARRLGELLRRVEPEYDRRPPRSAAELVARVAAEAGLPVVFGIAGTSHEHVASIADNAPAPAAPISTAP